jgi:Zn-dependent membrane protease YugP
MYLEYYVYIATVIAIILAVWAQVKVSTTFNRYSRTPTATNRTAEEVARMILDNNGLTDVRIERVHGNLSDHYDPRSKVLRLSDTVYGQRSAAAIGVAAHEAGHAIQHKVGYAPVVLRSKMVPVTAFASRFTWVIIVLGILFMGTSLGYIALHVGIGLFAITTLFQLVTLPCEFDASKRALEEMDKTGLYSSGELAVSRKVLSAAALTYVSSLLVSVLQLLRLIIRVDRNRR